MFLFYGQFISRILLYITTAIREAAIRQALQNVNTNRTKNLTLYELFVAETIYKRIAYIFIFYVGSDIVLMYYHHHYHHQRVLNKGWSFNANAGTKVAVLSKGRRSTANSGSKIAVLLGINRCRSFSLLSAPHSLFII